MEGLKVQRLRIRDIKVQERARIDKGDIEELAATISEKGLIQPITVNANMRLLAGERRLLAHMFLGLEEIEAIVRPTTDMVDAFEIEMIENAARKDMTWQELCILEQRIFDEKSKKGGWNQRKQGEMLKQSPMSTNRRLQMAEALDLIPDLAKHKTFDDAWKELKSLEEDAYIEAMKQSTPKEVKQASQWARDHYKVGDTFVGMAGLRKELVHFAEVDPPYAVDLNKRKERNTKNNMEEYNEVDQDEYEIFFKKVATETYRILKPDSFAVFWYGWDWHADIREWLLEAGFAVPTIPAIWNKGNAGQTASPDTTLGSCHEPFWLARKGKPKLVKPGRGNVFSFDPVAPTRKTHPTERPIALMKEIIELCCFPGSITMVPFLGSGVTLRAAYKTGHTGFGWDLSEVHKNRFLKAVMEDGEDGEAD